MLQKLKIWFDSVRYRRLRKDKWLRFCLLRQAVESKGDPLLKVLLNKLGYSYQSDLLNIWFNYLSSQIGRPFTREVEQKLSLYLDDVLPSELPSLAWLDLYRLLLGFGYFSAAQPLRAKALMCFINDAMDENATLLDMKQGLAALIDQGHWSKAEVLLARMKKNGLAPDRLAFATWLIGTLSGQLHNQVSPLHPSSTFFTKLIHGKRLALVGPASKEINSGATIDAFDLVVKFNYKGGAKGCDPIIQGQRIDISYYNLEQSRFFAKQDYLPVFNSLAAIVFIKKKGGTFFKEKLEHMRSIVRLDWLLVDSELNVGPNAMLDCIAAGANEVTIFNTDLMLTKGRDDGYRPAGAPPINYLRSFVKTHDPVMQYQFFRHAWNAGLIKGDQRFCEVMEMGLENYISELQLVHGAPS